MIAADSANPEAAAPPAPVWSGRIKRIGVVALIGTPILAALETSFPLCPTAATFGIPCPGCGLTRATLAVLHGHLIEALRIQPVVLLVAPIYGVMVALGVFNYVRGPATRPPQRWMRTLDRVLGPWALVALVVMLGVWIARFAGYLGGPVPVETFRHWAAAHAASVRR